MFSHRAWHKKRFAENAEYREKVRAAQRRYRENHKEKIRERRRLRLQSDPDFRERERARDREWKRQKRYKQVYGISLADYDAMLQRQDGACAICKKSNEALCVDHCHGCNEVRGSFAPSATARSGFATTVPSTCWGPPRTCWRRGGRCRRSPDFGRVGQNRHVAGARANRTRRSRMPVIVAAPAKPYESGVT
jgi:Recombination endonuclease VII